MAEDDLRVRARAAADSYRLSSAPDVCVYCGRESGELDHVPPLSLTLEYAEEFPRRLYPACGKCNARLGNFSAACLVKRVEFLAAAYSPFVRSSARPVASVCECPLCDPYFGRSRKPAARRIGLYRAADARRIVKAYSPASGGYAARVEKARRRNLQIARQERDVLQRAVESRCADEASAARRAAAAAFLPLIARGDMTESSDWRPVSLAALVLARQSRPCASGAGTLPGSTAENEGGRL